jgi:ATP-dependent Clp protease adaptor protein ClpS
MSVMCIIGEPLERTDEQNNERAKNLAGRYGRRERLFLLHSGVKADRITGDPSMVGETDAGRKNAPAELHETKSGRADRWAVVLFDDDHHSMDYVIWALLKTVPELSTADASLIMLEAHNTGKGVVTLCGRAQAGVYRDALRVLQLGCDVEPGW